MTSLITFENQFRERLLDIIYGQGSLLGIPYSSVGFEDEVIDPEALLWCLQEYIHDEPRLREFHQWFYENRSKLLVKRIEKLEKTENRIRGILSEDDNRESLSKRTKKIAGLLNTLYSKLGRPSDQPATLLLRARDFFGLDARPFLLTFLLANPDGGRLRDLQQLTGYTYRAFYNVVVSWKNVGILSNDGGFCRLVDPEPFKALFKIGEKRILWINWRIVFETSVRLLRDLEKARSKGFDEGSGVFSTLLREAKAAIKEAALQARDLRETSIGRLLEIFPE